MNEKIIFLFVGIVLGAVVSGLATCAVDSRKLDDARNEIDELKKSNQRIEKLYKGIEEQNRKFRNDLNGLREITFGLESGVDDSLATIDGIIDYIRRLRESIEGTEIDK